MITRRDVMIGVSLFVAGFAVRLFFASRLVFPPLDDPAFYLQTARNLGSGAWSGQRCNLELLRAVHFGHAPKPRVLDAVGDAVDGGDDQAVW